MLPKRRPSSRRAGHPQPLIHRLLTIALWRWGAPQRCTKFEVTPSVAPSPYRTNATDLCKSLDMAQHRGQRIGYARVSSTDQNLARQITTLGEVDRLFEEKHSGARREGRTALAEMIAYARKGDTVAIPSMDRLARSVVDLNQVVAELVSKGVVVEFIHERVTFRPGATDIFAEFQLNIMASFAQLERAIGKERQAEGIHAAKARGVYTGRARKLSAEDLAQARELIDTGVPKAQIARKLSVNRSTLHRALTLDVEQVST